MVTPNTTPTDPVWVDETLLRGPDWDVALWLDRPVDRLTLRHLVADCRRRMSHAGLSAGGRVALQLPPSLAYVGNLLAAWRLGAQVLLLDHRLTRYEVDRILDQLRPELIVAPASAPGVGMRSFTRVTARYSAYPGRPADTPHALIQLSSGSTGPSKVIGRTAADVIAELHRYTRIEGSPQPGERVVLLASIVHVLGLVGGLLHGLHVGATVSLPERLTADSILTTIRADPKPATVLGVPFHTELLTSVAGPQELRAFKRMTTGGEPVRDPVRRAFADRFGVPLGNMYGMTEVGVIATDLDGAHTPALTPAPDMVLREVDGELWLRMPTSPYLGRSDPRRWSDGWLRTHDAGSVDERTGLVTVHGRLDSQVSVGGLKVDLTDVEHTLVGLPGVVDAVVVYTGRIEAYVQLEKPEAEAGLEQALADRLAAYKRPRAIRVVASLPRTATGKLVRDAATLSGRPA